MFKNEGGGVKGRLNNVKKNRRFGTGGRPLGKEQYLVKAPFQLLLQGQNVRQKCSDTWHIPDLMF